MKTILASVSDKTGLVELLQAFQAVEPLRIIATGSTAKHLETAGLTVETVESITGFPEILEGRVKTLHPIVFGGILAKDSPEHEMDLRAHGIPRIDVVIVNLYPFEQTIQHGASESVTVENIDIGGVALIRAAAKNFQHVAVLCDPTNYSTVAEELKASQGQLSLSFRKMLAQKAFEHTARYDSLIATYFMKQITHETPPAFLPLSFEKIEDLRYGENPHEKAAWYGQVGRFYKPFEQLQGKQMSANNLVDAYAATKILQEFPGDPVCCIIKHNNPCGVAVGSSVDDAYQKAYDSDPVSAFGGIFGFNRSVTKLIAEKISGLFVEIVLAPDFDADALEVLSQKKNVRVLKVPMLSKPVTKKSAWMLKDLEDFGVLMQEKSLSNTLPELSTVTQLPLPENTLADVAFAWGVVKHLTSNAICIVKNGRTIGYGIGQTSRIASMEIALRQASQEAQGAVLASDGFFPATDNIEAAAKAGICVIVQPGGSIKDPEVIEAANHHGLAMVMTHERCFKH